MSNVIPKASRNEIDRDNVCSKSLHCPMCAVTFSSYFLSTTDGSTDAVYSSILSNTDSNHARWRILPTYCLCLIESELQHTRARSLSEIFALRTGKMTFSSFTCNCAVRGEFERKFGCNMIVYKYGRVAVVSNQYNLINKHSKTQLPRSGWQLTSCGLKMVMLRVSHAAE